MKTQTYLKVVGYYKDCNLGVKCVAAVYYINSKQRENGAFERTKENVLEKKHLFFDWVESMYLDLPYQPKNVFKNVL